MQRGWRRDQFLEFLVLVLLYLLQMINAEMLRRAIDVNPGWQPSPSTVSASLSVICNQIHPIAMLVLGIWLGLMGLAMLQRRQLPRWSFDGLGCWFCLRLVVEFLIINVLIFEPALVAPGVLLGQIVLYLPFFVVTWGWFFHRLDWVGRSEAGQTIKLNDIDPNSGVSRFDYFHSAINTLLNKGKPTITGIDRSGRITVLVFNGMLLALYAVAFTRVLQLTKAVV